ncbi:S-layer homology domain-containing protein [Lysinibacillus contaminans]|uniref:CAP and S-layer homology domain-containing protein n=1 Tax=Lysinibacillus contaminans TaxID=1293441 RepID=UPI0006B040AE|nr:S-layer homology domain-containing protein [Lysinibacillus contaminans]
MFKKILGIVVLFLILQVTSCLGSLTSVSTAVAAPNLVKDVPVSHWANSSIQHMLTKRYMPTYADGTFKPEQVITRAEAASAIARSMQVNLESSFLPNFNDLSITHPYYKEICKLVEIGVLQNNDVFHPEEPLKRMHIAKMLTLAYEIEVDTKNKSKFTDVLGTHWAKDYIESLADVGVIQGIDPKHFAPNRLVTRAQLAVLVERSIDFNQKVKKFEVAYDYLSKDYIPTVNFSTVWSQDVIRLINVERQKNKLNLLTNDTPLTQIAIIKAQDMVNLNYFEHVSPYYGAPWDLATLFDYSYTSFGENIARNIPSPEAAVKAWMASPTHRDNIMKTNYTNTGVAVEKDNKGNYYWVQMFSSQ